ncbi:M18 family aminopeptidase [Denitrificimonas caeni]|uniref:M18 family aminopeptidase n=1 Tax=Denitrificimonas caeni TaxID=521720 RepID=UPI0003B5F64A|nr:M18 family aminopeptidase [Denitrificimonas caeni]
MHNTPSQGLLDFLKRSPSPFHATQSMAEALQAAGYQALDERETWQLQPQGRYYVTRNDSSIIAIKLGQHDPVQHGIRMVGAHTDSPCLKVKPQPELSRHGYWQLGVEVYGGVLLSPWFDRDLSLAGRVTFKHNEQLQSRLIDFKHAIASIPSLAIHLNREANSGWAINAQTELPPVLAQLQGETKKDFRALLADQLQREHAISDACVLDYELCFYDSQPAAFIGLNQDFIASARLDNLLSCYSGLQALLHSDDQHSQVLVCTDHEEVGSNSACGADGPFLEQVLRRVLNSEEDFVRCIQHSLLISADNAHGIHPNYADKHDANHGPLLNHGPVIKVNANQRYATTSETSSFFKLLCQQADIPVQSFVTRSDLGCGSTIGPITASQLGVQTIDIGVPTFAMHSIRELAGSKDLGYLVSALQAFYNSPQLP